MMCVLFRRSSSTNHVNYLQQRDIVVPYLVHLRSKAVQIIDLSNLVNVTKWPVMKSLLTWRRRPTKSNGMEAPHHLLLTHHRRPSVTSVGNRIVIKVHSSSASHFIHSINIQSNQSIFNSLQFNRINQTIECQCINQS